MDFSFTEAQDAIRDTLSRLCAKYDADYWRTRDAEGGMPENFVAEIANGGWLGIAMPEEYGGAGLGVTEAAIMMQTIAESGAAMSGASAIHIAIFGLNPVVVFGTEDQKRRALPPLIAGADRACFGVTEPNAGLDTSKIETRAVLDKNSGLTLVLALSYGSRTEIVDATRAIAEKAQAGQLDPAEVNEHLFSKHLYTHHIPDPDLLIRTSGEMRLSNFLLWQVSYAGMVVTPTRWPEFRKPQFHAALEEYAKRHRRFGKL